MSTPTPRTDEARRIDNGDTHPLLDEMETMERELTAERARLDYMSTRGFEHRHHETGDHLAYEWTISSTNELKDVSLREVIDAAMKEAAK